jgi:biopolymer transport protein ExbB/TolQ
MSFSFSALWGSMGMGAKMVVITLALMSIYSLGVMVERLIALSKSKKQSVKYAGMLNGMLAQGDTDHAAAAAESLKLGYLPRVLGAGLKEYQNVIDRPDQSKHDKIELTERAIDRTTQRTVSDLRRGLGGLATIGSSAPFVGLFGTVLGIINAFELMAAKGSGGLATVSAGISEALITTAFGLLVAIPAVAVYNYFTNTVDGIVVDINDASSELMAYLSKRTPDADAA